MFYFYDRGGDKFFRKKYFRPVKEKCIDFNYKSFPILQSKECIALLALNTLGVFG